MKKAEAPGSMTANPQPSDSETYRLDLPAGFLRSYHPHLARWEPAVQHGDASHTFDVYELRPGADDRDAHAARGRLVCTITVDRVFSPQVAKAIAWLMSRAPAIWRDCREVATYAARSDAEGLELFQRAERTLYDAAGDWPYQDPAEPIDEHIAHDRMASEAAGRELSHPGI